MFESIDGKENPLLVSLTGDLLEAAKAVLGCFLVSGERVAQIVEVEAYGSEPGSHAHRGRTPRNAVMFGPPGVAYIYLNYGVHWLLNVTARPEGEPGAILIRAAIPIEGHGLMRLDRPKARGDEDLLSGPGKLTQGMGIGPFHRGTNLLGAGPVRLIPAAEPTSSVVASRRIGLAAGKGDELLWRFLDANAGRWWSASQI